VASSIRASWTRPFIILSILLRLTASAAVIARSLAGISLICASSARLEAALIGTPGIIRTGANRAAGGVV